MDNAVQISYQAWPARACIIDTNGVIQFISSPGPRGMNPEEIKAALEAILPKTKP